MSKIEKKLIDNSNYLNYSQMIGENKMIDYQMVSQEELLKKTRIPMEVVETDIDIYNDMARVMLELIKTNNIACKNTVFIVPVGPVFQYRRFVRLANMENLDCSKVYIINMDEYMADEKTWIDINHPLSFRGFMERELYSGLKGASIIPKENRIFPEPGKETFIWERIQELGGVDITMGGLGICGHIAFNEALEPGKEMPNEIFRSLPTRVLRLTRETRTINSVTGLGGYIDGIPEWCITVGMKEILSSRRVVLYLNREWQRGAVRKACLGVVTGHHPASFLQEHPNAKIIMASSVAQPPAGIIR
jgi:glucosamine-6-phosphate deaminase